MKPTDLSGLPSGVGEHLEGEGIAELYPPQAEAVEKGVTDGGNVVAAVPTASGKTLIAELAMLSAVERGGKALYIVPLRALASEKKAEFERWEEYGVTVGVSTGNYQSDGEWLGSRDIIVATSEKVDSLIRNGAPWVDDLTCVVSDEVHLVDDRNRGPTLEVTLAKLRRINPNLQTVALSATVGNAPEIADWLDAELVDSDWRPIDLKTGVHYGNAINFDDGSQREVPVDRKKKQTEALVDDVLDEGGSSLVFVNSRRNAESAATRLGGVSTSHLTDDERAQLRTLAQEIRDVSDTQTSDDLADCVARGAAFHHAGLASEHRSLIEGAFRDRLVKVVCATPTLAAGVNTPSRRVVVRDWRRYDPEFGGMKPLDTLEIHQMMGRAGRPGLDPYGEAVLLAKDSDTMDELFERYVWGEAEPVRSKLAAEPALRTHLLATIASGFASTREGILDFLDNTLYAVQSDGRAQLERVTDSVLSYLEVNEFVEETDGTYKATGVGHTVSRLYVDPMSAAEMIDGLRTAEASGADAEAASPATDSRRTPPEEQTASAESSPGGGGFTTASEYLTDDDSSEGDADTADADTTEDDAGDREPIFGESAGDDSDSDSGEPTADEESADDADDSEPSGVFTLDSASSEGSGTEAVDVSALGCYHLVSRTPDMYQLYLKSGDREEYTELCYEREGELLGRTPSEYEDVAFEEWLSALKTARLLEDWADEVDEDRITERYGVGPGDIRGKVDTAQWLLGAAESLASELDLATVQSVREAKMRVEYGVREELLDLAGIRGVGRKRARQLYEADIGSRADLREADKSVVLGALKGQKTAESVLENVGREDPSMDDVSADADARRAARDDDGDGQASLGDFG